MHPQSMTSVCVGHWSLAGSQSDAMNRMADSASSLACPDAFSGKGVKIW